MKKILYYVLLISSSSLNAQVKVYPGGRTLAGNPNSISTPFGQLHVLRPLDQQFQAIYADAPTSFTSFPQTFASLYLSNSDMTDNNYSRINFGDGDPGAVSAIAARIESHGNNAGSLEFWTRPNAPGAGITRRMLIANDGSVSIGEPPASMPFLLNVNGSASKVGGGTWSVFSDQLLKKNITEFQDGLESILKMNPVRYQYNGKAGITDTETEYVGLIAQEMQEIAPYMVENVKVRTASVKTMRNKDDSSLEKDVDTEREENYLQFDPNALTYMLINAIQEQQKMIEDLKETMVDLKMKFAQDSLQKYKVVLSADGDSNLAQNIPNPFTSKTKIPFLIPEGTEMAELKILSNTGQILHSVKIKNHGPGEIDVEAWDLPAGTYIYELILDGQRTGSKKMIKAN